MELSLSPNLKIKNFGPVIFLFDSHAGNLIKASSKIVEIIDFLKDGTRVDGYDDELLPLIENGLLRRNDQIRKHRETRPAKAGELYNLRFHVSNRCNHDCRYCHVFGKDTRLSGQPQLMGYDVIQLGLNSYFKLTEGRRNTTLEFSFYGGEPLFNWPVIKKALSYGNMLFQKSKKITWILNTNGTMITRDRARELSNEGVDVHLSIDGPDESSNQNRRFKSGRPALRQALNALDILRQENCRVQFDSCLTMENRNCIEPLIDLAAAKDVDRIYLALTDETPATQRDSWNPREIAGLLVKAMVYGERKGVVVGGPWKCFYPWLVLPKTSLANPVPHFIVGTSGEFYLPAFPEQKLGHIDQIQRILASSSYDKMQKQLEAIRISCSGCELEGVCAGYLKAMVRYHTGSMHGHERECGVARAAFDEYLHYLANIKAEHIPSRISVPDGSLLDEPLIHSRHLKVKHVNNRCQLVHGLTGKLLEVSVDTLEFIDAFRDVEKPLAILRRYQIPNITRTIQTLLRNNVLIASRMDEELEYLNRKFSMAGQKNYETSDCLCLYPPDHVFLAERFTQLIQKLYSSLRSKFRPLRQKMIIYVCGQREELSRFWFESHLPAWINGFVALRRVLVVDVNTIKNDDWVTPRFKAGMTHEIVHMALGNANACLPIWLEEGLCEYFAKSDPTDKLLSLVKKKQFHSFREIESNAIRTLLDIDNSNTDENICYRQAHSFVSYLCETLGRDKFLTWANSLGLRTDFRQAFLDTFGKAMDESEQEWLSQLQFLSYQKI